MSSTASLLSSLLTHSRADLARRVAEREQDSAAGAAFDSLAVFVRRGWPILEPSCPLAWNWHLDAVIEALERQIAGDAKWQRLLIVIPPGTAKSLLVSVFAPAWEWLRNPSRRKLFFANDDALAKRDSRRMREIVTSAWYRGIVAWASRERGVPSWDLAQDQNEKINFENTARGFRQCMSLGSRVTGRRADDLVIDDPLDAKEVINGSLEQVAARLAVVNNVIEKVLPSRVNDLRLARWTMIMQRLHDDDPAGRAAAAGDWRVIEIQMEFDPSHAPRHPLDPRRRAGDLLFSERFPAPELAKLRERLGIDYDSQYQQHPRGRGGLIFRPFWWNFWYPADGPMPRPELSQDAESGQMREHRQAPLPAGLEQLQSWDMAFKKTKTSAYVVGQTWGWKGANAYLLDQIRERLDIVGTIDAVERLTARWPLARAKLIEDKANGPAVMDTLRNKIPGMIPITPEGDKEARARAAAPDARAGNVWLPHPAFCPWTRDLLAELNGFPNVRYKDQVDTLTQALASIRAEIGRSISLAGWKPGEAGVRANPWAL